MNAHLFSPTKSLDVAGLAVREGLVQLLLFLSASCPIFISLVAGSMVLVPVVKSMCL